MGLLNYVRCRYPLPDAEAQDLMFQTKSMPDLCMATYEVTPEGTLVRRKAIQEESDDTESASVPSSLQFGAGKPLPVQGELEIYTSADRADGRSCWYSYRLSFRDAASPSCSVVRIVGKSCPCPNWSPNHEPSSPNATR